MNNIMKYQTTLDKISKESTLLVGEAQSEFKTRADEFMNVVHESQYIKVPLVGVFSAGKSSLLNVFTQKPGMLPVDTMPETAVAYELYYAQTECVDLYRNGSKIDSKPLADIKQLDTKPGDIAKVYCTSEPIKKLQERGIILVDMPGIGSGIERHDAAIFNYIHSGTAFLLMVDAEQGSLRGSTLAFMNELGQYGMHPAVLVSKTDKKPEEDVKGIIEYITYQLKNIGNANPYVGTVCAVNNNLSGLTDYLSSLDAEALLSVKLNREITRIINFVADQFKVRIELRSKDIANVEEKISQISSEIEKVKTELPMDASNAESPEKSAQDILDNVRLALEAKATDIAQMIIDGEDQEDIKSFIVTIVRTEIFKSLKEESIQYSEAVSNAAQEAANKLAAIDITIGDMGDIKEIIDDIFEFLDKLLDFIPGMWGSLAQMLGPAIKELIKVFLSKSNEDILNEVCEKVMEKCVKLVITDLQPRILEITKENQKRIQERIQAELVAKMEQVREGFREKMEDANKSKAEIEQELENLNAAVLRLEEVRVNL